MPLLHIAADAAIGVAYLAVSVALLSVARTRAELRRNSTLIAGTIFTIAAGAAHFADAWMLWRPGAWLAGSVRLLAAAAALFESMGMPVPAEEAAEHERTLARIRETFAAQQIDDWAREGRDAPLDDMIADALELTR